MKYIDIDKNLIPYSFDTVIDGETYKFDINYNDKFDFFTVNLYKNGETIVLGEKLVYAKPMFLTSTHKDIPNIDILPFDLAQQTDRITYDNFNKQVFLFLVEGD